MDRFTSQETNTKNGKGPFLRRWGFFLLLLTIGALHTVRSRSSKYGNSMEAEKNLTMSRHLRSLQSRELKKNRKETGTGDNDGGGTGGKGGGKGKGKNKATTVVTVTSTEVPVTTTTTTTEPPTTTSSTSSSTTEATFTTTTTEEKTCPQTHCSSDEAVVFEPSTSPECSNLVLTTLGTVEYQGDVWVELLGPQNPEDAAAVVLTVGHGGELTPEYMEDRTTDDSSCPASGCKVDTDSFSPEIAFATAQSMKETYCRLPYIVINRLARIKLDANREKEEAAQGYTLAGEAWEGYHSMIATAQEKVMAKFGTTTNTATMEGITGLLVDVHTYKGFDWDPTNGGSLVQWGYTIGENSLNPDNFCPLDSRTDGVMGTFTFGRNLEGESYECLVRGPKSLASRVMAFPLTSAAAQCGTAIPSYQYPSVTDVAEDPAFCGTLSSRDACTTYEGGFTNKVHEVLDWKNHPSVTFENQESYLHMNTVQLEIPRCIAWATEETRGAVHAEFSHAVSVGVCSFLNDLFPFAEPCGPP